MFTTPAYAQGFGLGGDGGQAIVQFLPIVLIFVVFYFLLIRPQQKKAKEHKTMLSALRRGDRVVTGGGIVGTVARVNANDEEIAVDIAENVRVKVLRSTITAVLARTEPVKETGAVDADEADAKGKKRVAGGK
jgi:preprotein translocase subunit YajC